MIRCPGKPDRACGATTLEAQRVSGERVLVSCLACGRFRWVGRDRRGGARPALTVAPGAPSFFLTHSYLL